LIAHSHILFSRRDGARYHRSTARTCRRRRAGSPTATDRAHARSGDRIALAAYLGSTGNFDHVIADLPETYADQNERDYAALQAAVKDGKAEATAEI
jgi:hypothetical protein